MDAFVSQHLSGVSRTYALLIPMLPAGLADAVGLAYLLMRVVDTIEDAPQLTDDARLRCFGELDTALQFEPGLCEQPPAQVSVSAAGSTMAARDFDGLPCGAADSAARARQSLAARAAHTALGDLVAEHALMRHIPELTARIAELPAEYRTATVTCARSMMSGVRMMMSRSNERGVAYPGNRDAAELREYCYYVAGVVGEMLCEMMAHHLRSETLTKLRGVAVELGIGLQLVNILKDSLRDAQGGRRYLPLADGKVAPGEMYKLVLAEARASLKRGSEFVLALPTAARELRCFCGLPIAWGAMTLARAETDASAAKITRSAIQSSIDLFKRLVGDDTALRGWLTSMLRPTPA